MSVSTSKPRAPDNLGFWLFPLNLFYLLPNRLVQPSEEDFPPLFSIVVTSSATSPLWQTCPLPWTPASEKHRKGVPRGD